MESTVCEFFFFFVLLRVFSCCFPLTCVTLNFQDPLVVKAPKKSPLVSRLVVLAFAMICGVYICSICLKQIGPHTMARILNFQIFDQECNKSGIEPWELPYVHYPKPETFRRYPHNIFEFDKRQRVLLFS